MLRRLYAQFKLNNLRIVYYQPYEFITCRWQLKREVSVLFLLYRVFYFLYILLFIYCLVRDPCLPKEFFAYFTTWCLLLWMVEAFAGLAVVTYAFIEQYERGRVKNHPFLFGFYWALFSTYNDVCYILSLFYWGCVHFDGTPHTINIYNIGCHILNSLFMLVDFFIVACPVQILHVYTTLGFISMYLLFNVLYCELGGKDPHGNQYLYVILNWNEDLITAIIATFLFILFTVIIRFCNVFLYFLRSKIHETFFW